MNQVAVYSDTSKDKDVKESPDEDIKRRLKELQDHQGER